MEKNKTNNSVWLFVCWLQLQFSFKAWSHRGQAITSNSFECFGWFQGALFGLVQFNRSKKEHQEVQEPPTNIYWQINGLPIRYANLILGGSCFWGFPGSGAWARALETHNTQKPTNSLAKL